MEFVQAHLDHTYQTWPLSAKTPSETYNPRLEEIIQEANQADAYNPHLEDIILSDRQASITVASHISTAGTTCKKYDVVCIFQQYEHLNAPLSRGQALKLLMRYAKLDPVQNGMSHFLDIPLSDQELQ